MSALGIRIAALGVAIVGAAAYGLSCLENLLQATDALWVVADYAEPWRSLAAIAVCALLYRATRRATKQGKLREFWLVAALSFALLFELGKGVQFHPVSGVLEVHYALIPLRRLKFHATTQGVCVRPDLSSLWVWRLNQHRLWHLPLPKNLESFEAEVVGSSEAQYRSQPEACREP